MPELNVSLTPGTLNLEALMEPFGTSTFITDALQDDEDDTPVPEADTQVVDAFTGLISDPRHPLFKLTAHRLEGKYGYYGLIDMKNRVRRRLNERMATWTAHSWRYGQSARLWRLPTGWVKQTFVATNYLISDYVRAHMAEPDRIDILGDLEAVVTEQSKRVAGDYYAYGRLAAKFPAIATMGVVRSVYGAGKRYAWTPTHWAMEFYGATGMTQPQYVLDTYKQLPIQCGHLVHVSKDDPMKVAYIKSVRDLMRYNDSGDINGSWVTKTTPGRYLNKYYPYLGEAKIKEMANQHTTENSPVEVLFARTSSECAHVVGYGPSESCMANGNHDEGDTWYRGHIHPAYIYGYADNDPTKDADTEVLYFKSGDDIKARVICNIKDKTCARIYGDADKLRRAIEKLGYKEKPGALEGCRIRRIEDHNGNGHIMAYVDAGTASGGGCLGYEYHSDKWWMLTYRDDDDDAYSTYQGYDSRGVTDHDEDEGTIYCSHCERARHEEDSAYVEGHGDICRNCLDNDFVWARGRLDCEYYHVDDVVYCETDGEHYLEGWAEYNDVYQCESSGQWYKRDDMVSTAEGYVYQNFAVQLDEPDEDGNEYASSEDDTELTHDGRRIHYSAAAVDHFDGTVYHVDDDEVIRFTQPRAMLWQTLETYTLYCTAETLKDNLDAFMMLGDVVFVNLASRERSERGVIPLPEYLATFGAPQPANPYINSVFFDVLADIAEDIRSEQEAADDYQIAA